MQRYEVLNALIRGEVIVHRPSKVLYHLLHKSSLQYGDETLEVITFQDKAEKKYTRLSNEFTDFEVY